MSASPSAQDVLRDHQLELAYELLLTKDVEIEALRNSLTLADSMIALLRGETVQTPVLVDTARRVRAQNTIAPTSALGKAMAEVVASFQCRKPSGA